MPRLDELPETLAKGLVAIVHLRQPLLVLGELDVEVVDGLRATRADGDHVERRLVERPDADGVLLLFELVEEEADATGHLVYTTDLGHV